MKELLFGLSGSTVFALVLSVAFQGCTPKNQEPKVMQPNGNVLSIAHMLGDENRRYGFLYRHNKGSYFTGGIQTRSGKRYDMEWFDEKNLLVLQVDNKAQYRLHVDGTLEGTDDGENLRRANSAMEDILRHFGHPTLYSKQP